MNTYKKYCPNVFVASCEERHEKGDLIELTTKYNKVHECEVHNFLGITGTKEEPRFLYSITRTDGFNHQKRAENKAEKLKGYAINAAKRSNEAYNKADLSEKNTGIVFGQPILVGHHSERKHRKTIERAHNAMNKSIEERDKADTYINRADYWKKQADKINLSMPESLAFYAFNLDKAQKEHQKLKENPKLRTHNYSLTYAKKVVNENKRKFDIAVQLWGNSEEIAQLNSEKEQKESAKANKSKKQNDLIKKLGGFFHFGSDMEAFNLKVEKLKEDKYLEEGEKVQHVFSGLYMPVKNVKTFLNAKH